MSDIDRTDRDGRTALHQAAARNDWELAAGLIAQGADVNAADRAGNTALHLTAQEHAGATARLLIGVGAEVDAVNRFGNTPLFTAVFHSRGRGEIIELLLAAGADPTRTNDADQSPRGLAELISNYDVRQFFHDS